MAISTHLHADNKTLCTPRKLTPRPCPRPSQRARDLRLALSQTPGNNSPSARSYNPLFTSQRFRYIKLVPA